MRGGDRRRSPPPRGRDDRGPPSGGRGGRYPPPPPRGAGDRRRPRSMSPPDRYRRSPPPPKRFRGREPDYDYPEHDRYGGRDGYGRRGGHGPGGYPRGRPDDRYDRSPPPRRDQPMVFREFMMTLSDDITPEAAKEAFSRYLANWWGDAIKAEFEQRKGEQGLRKQFDPREIQKLMDHRNECARAAAARFAEDLAAGRLDPSAEGFNQADDGSAPGPEGYGPDAGGREDDGAAAEAAKPPGRAPALCWAPAQLAADLALGRQVMQLLDKEKGVEGNPLAAAAAAGEEGGKPAPAPEERAKEGEGGAEEPAGDEGKGEQQAQPPAENGGAGAAADMAVDGEPAAGGGSGGQQQQQQQQLAAELAGELDQVLAYLWRVHGVDYYGGREYYDPEEPGRAAVRRTLRQPAPPPVAPPAAAAPAAAGGAEAEDEAAAAGGEKEGEGAGRGGGEEGGAAAAEKEGDKEGGDAKPAAAAEEGAAGGKEVTKAAGKERGAGAGGADKERERYEHRVTGFWRYRLDHPDPLEPPLQRKRVEEQLEAFIDEQIIRHEENKWGNKLSNKLFVAREFVVKHIRNKHGHVLEAERDKALDAVYFDNFRAFKEEEQRQRREAEEAERRAALEGRGGEGDGKGPAGGMGGMPILDPSAMLMDPSAMLMADPAMAMMGAGQIFVPGPAGLTPVIMAPMDMGVVMGGGLAMGGGLGMGGRGGRGRGGRGPMRGGRGGPMGAPLIMGGPGAKLDAGGVREYFDLDAPANNRAVLDYGDL